MISDSITIPIGDHKRMDKLRAHLKTRRGRRDLQALTRLAEIKNGIKRGARLATLDSILKEIYTTDKLQELLYAPNPFMKLIASADCPVDRIFVLPVEKKP